MLLLSVLVLCYACSDVLHRRRFEENKITAKVLLGKL